VNKLGVCVALGSGYDVIVGAAHCGKHRRHNGTFFWIITNSL